MSLVEDFRKAADNNGIYGFALDVDDTVIRSSESLWGTAFRFFAKQVSQKTGASERKVLKATRGVNDYYYRASESGVHPRKYHLIAKDIAEMFGCDPHETKSIMAVSRAMIYLGTPPLTREAKRTIGLIRDIGRPFVFASHSPRGRLTLLREAWDLDGDVPMVDWTTRKRKGLGIWIKVSSELNMPPECIVAVDDNLSSINAAVGVGMIGVHVQPKWKEYAEGVTAPGVIRIGDIGKLVPALIYHFGK